MNEKIGTSKWEGEYCGSFDFKSRTFKVEAPVTTDVEKNERVSNVEQEITILSVRRGKKASDQERNMSDKVEVAKSETWGVEKSEPVHMMRGENRAEKRSKDEKMEVDSDWKLKSSEAGVVVWVKEESFKQEVLQPRQPAEKATEKKTESSNCDDLVWCGELVWHETSSILPLVNSCLCTVTGSKEVVRMLPTRLTMRLISMRVVQSFQTELLQRCHRLELVPCHQEGGEQTLTMALATMAGIVNQGDQLAMLLLHSKAKGVIYGFVFKDKVDLSNVCSTATARKQEAARYFGKTPEIN